MDRGAGSAGGKSVAYGFNEQCVSIQCVSATADRLPRGEDCAPNLLPAWTRESLVVIFAVCLPPTRRGLSAPRPSHS